MQSAQWESNSLTMVKSLKLSKHNTTLLWCCCIFLDTYRAHSGGGCKIYRLYLCWWVRPHLNECPWYDIKQSDGEAPALEIWGMWSIPSLPLLPSPLCPEVVAPDRVLSMDQIEQCANRWLILDCDLYSNSWNHLTVCKKELRLI